jgi:hypothetical protein
MNYSFMPFSYHLVKVKLQTLCSTDLCSDALPYSVSLEQSSGGGRGEEESFE